MPRCDVQRVGKGFFDSRDVSWTKQDRFSPGSERKRLRQVDYLLPSCMVTPPPVSFRAGTNLSFPVGDVEGMVGLRCKGEVAGVGVCLKDEVLARSREDLLSKGGQVLPCQASVRE